MKLVTFLLPSALTCVCCHMASAFVTSPSSRTKTCKRHHVVFLRPDLSTQEEPVQNDSDDDAIEEASAAPSVVIPDGRYDVSKLVGSADDGAGFNQFDPVLKVTGFLSRRFGIVGGLALVAALAAVEGREILQSILSEKEEDLGVGDAEAVTTTTASGLRITEVRIGKSGPVPLPGFIIGIRAVVSIGDKVIYNTGDDKPIAFKLGQRPFQNVLCQGVEEGIQGMRVGGKRVLQVPKELAPPGVNLPPGVPLVYEVELTEVLSGYF